MTPLQFIDKWRPVTLSERSAAQSHFHDLCRLFDHPDPISVDPTGEWFTFEKGLVKAGGGDGFADVWKRSHFAWEYKKKKRNLDDALGQLARYALALENPPLHIVCDTDRFRIVTAWTNTVPRAYDISLEELLDPTKRGWLEAAFHRPEKLKPGGNRADLTKVAADKFSTLAARLQDRGHLVEEVGHFVNRLAFLFFAEDVKIVEDGYFRKILRNIAKRPADSKSILDSLFLVLKTGGHFGADLLPHVNGGLFDDRPSLPLDDSDIRLLVAAGSEDWAHIDPSIFGTLFERFLDPAKRSQIGAHYTDAEKIKKIIDPVIVDPLQEEWAAAHERIKAIMVPILTAPRMEFGKGSDTNRARALDRARTKAEAIRSAFLERLANISILDPACGSGNFLYSALHAVKDIELRANQDCEALGLQPMQPSVGPEILKGLEINPLAAELARTTIWIGDIQWGVRNGFRGRPEPILRSLKTVECRDALINSDGSQSAWPDAEFIVGNPPFLGVKKMIGALGEDYCIRLRAAYEGRVSPFSDLVCWWFDKARMALEKGATRHVGLVATNSIRGGKNRLVLDKIVDVSGISCAWSDEPWVNDGAAVRVSLICFSKPSRDAVLLDGQGVIRINSDLTAWSLSSGYDLTRVAKLPENAGLSFMATIKAGSFDIDEKTARCWLREPSNPNGRPNSDVLKRWFNGRSVTQRPDELWVVDFGSKMTMTDASQYEKPFCHVETHVYPQRKDVRKKQYREKWWLFAEPCDGMRRAISPLKRYIVTPTISKHRVFIWADKNVLADHALIAFARDDDTSFGILHSRFHEAWSLRLGTSLEDRPRYTPTTTFETFPFPLGLEPYRLSASFVSDPRAERIAKAASRLDELRQAWLNPSELVDVLPEKHAGYPARIVPRDAEAATILKQRTITRLYNEYPSWLSKSHEELDRAVAAAYGWPEDIAIDDAIGRLIQLNAERSGAANSAILRQGSTSDTNSLAVDEVSNNGVPDDRASEITSLVADNVQGEFAGRQKVVSRGQRRRS